MLPDVRQSEEKTQEIPFFEAIRQISRWSFQAAIKPSAVTFEKALVSVNLGVTWMQLLLIVGITVFWGVFPTWVHWSKATEFATGSTIALHLAGVVLLVILEYVFAKVFFHGQGSFLEQCSSYLLYLVPLSMGSEMLRLFLMALLHSHLGVAIGPEFGPLFLLSVSLLERLVALAVFVWGAILNFYQIKASHHLTTGKALGVVILAYSIPGVIVVWYAMISVGSAVSH
jgi:hypothetical protein